jgi:proliferating cell nuclear antigen
MDGEQIQTQQATAKIVTEEGSAIMKTILSNLANFVSEGKIIFDKEKGMYINIADKELFSVVRVNISPSFFDVFEVEGREEIALRFEDLKNVLKEVKKGDKITMYRDDKKFVIEIENRAKKKFLLPILCLEEENVPNIDTLTFKARVGTGSKELKKIINEAKKVDKYLTVYSDGKTVKFIANGEANSLEVELRDLCWQFDVKEESKATYRVEYLEKALKFGEISPDVVLEWSSDYPIKLTFDNVFAYKIEVAIAPTVSE